jgi:hypothetical protein
MVHTQAKVCIHTYIHTYLQYVLYLEYVIKKKKEGNKGGKCYIIIILEHKREREREHKNQEKNMGKRNSETKYSQ